MSILKNVGIKHGSEGPRHDPYSYMEIRWSNDGKVVILHLGLINWVMVNGVKTEGDETNFETLPVEIFERETGLKVDEIFEELHGGGGERVECDKCKSKDVEWQNGFPGEQLLQCNSCGHILTTSFNEGAII